MGVLTKLSLSHWALLVLLVGSIHAHDQSHAQGQGQTQEQSDIGLELASLTSSSSEVWQSIVAEEEDLGVPEHHRSQLRRHMENGQLIKTPLVLVVFHGYQDSPYWTTPLANNFYGRGHNVLNLRLAHHFHRDSSDLDQADFHDWKAQVEALEPLLHALGDRVVFVGHSTGGLMALYGSLLHPEFTAGLLLLSPALVVSRYVKWPTAAYRAARLPGHLLDTTLGLVNVQQERYLSPRAEVQVRRLGQFIRHGLLGVKWGRTSPPPSQFQQTLNHLPILVIDTSWDLVINENYNSRFFSHFENTEYICLSRRRGVFHTKMMLTDPEQNSAADFMMSKANDFVDRL